MRPPPDAIQEFKILTHSYGAEYGRNAGSVVNVVSRSGTNDVHGAAWEFNRDDALQARNFFALPTQAKPRLKQNQFGGALGGPVAKNRLFGFGYYEGYRNTSGVVQNFVVLSAAQRLGSFGTTTIRDPVNGAAVPGQPDPDVTRRAPRRCNCSISSCRMPIAARTATSCRRTWSTIATSSASVSTTSSHRTIRSSAAT